MSINKKAIVLGDNEPGKWHPFKAVEEHFYSILSTSFQVECSDDYNVLDEEKLNEYDLFVSYIDRFKTKISAAQRASLVRFVAKGGGLLVIHNGISLQHNHELYGLVGTRFTGHPPYTNLSFQINGEHPITNGIDPFTMDEEPYYFESFAYDTNILLTYMHEGEVRPAAWAHEYGLGKVVYLMPGHHAPSFEHLVFRQLIIQAAEWAAP